jgi:uncharacterized phage protein (TIGR01671 family)
MEGVDMQEIKFRAFRKGVMYPGLPLQELLEMAAKSGFDQGEEGVIWIQYTGLKDREGTEIYAGDIVTWGDVDGFIEMSGTRVAVVDMSVPEDGLTFDAFKPFKDRFKIGNFMYARSTHKCMTVIGNIYENQDLMEE